MGVPERVVLLDLDGTLIDEKYRLTTPHDQIQTAIKRVQGYRTVVGLNSDTPLRPFQSWAQRLAIAGPLIGEKGQVLATSLESPAEVLGTMGEFFHRLREEVVKRVSKEFLSAFIAVGDVTEFIRQRGRVYGEDQIAVLINGYRQCSFSAYALRVQDTELVKDSGLLSRFTELVRSVVGSETRGSIEEDENPAYGILILHEKEASKSLAVQRLIERMGTDLEYVMIGDGDSDIISADHPIRLCAVGNASPALKHHAKKTRGIVAEQPYTEGVIEILERL